MGNILQINTNFWQIYHVRFFVYFAIVRYRPFHDLGYVGDGQETVLFAQRSPLACSVAGRVVRVVNCNNKSWIMYVYVIEGKTCAIYQSHPCRHPRVPRNYRRGTMSCHLLPFSLASVCPYCARITVGVAR